MKVKPEHYEYMLKAISPCAGQIVNRENQLLNSNYVRDAYMRVRWDLFHLAGLTRYTCDNLYSYCDDTHIDTALKAIIKELKENT